MTARSGPARSGSPAASSPPAAAARRAAERSIMGGGPPRPRRAASSRARSEPAPSRPRSEPGPKRGAGLRHIVERLLAPVLELLPLLVALAGDDHHVAGLCGV